MIFDCQTCHLLNCMLYEFIAIEKRLVIVFGPKLVVFLFCSISLEITTHKSLTMYKAVLFNLFGVQEPYT